MHHALWVEKNEYNSINICPIVSYDSKGPQDICLSKSIQSAFEKPQMAAGPGDFAYVQSSLSTLFDGGQALVVDVGFQELLQLPQAVGDARHQVVHPPQVCRGKETMSSATNGNEHV